MEPREKLLETIELQKIGFETTMGGQPCPFYARVSELFLDDVRGGGAVWRWLEPNASAEFDQAYVLRLLGGLHRLALTDDAPELVARFPSTGGDGDERAAFAAIEALLADPPPVLVDMMRRPPQTNEVGRSVALVTGLMEVTNRLRMPIALREIGSSAGLNLRLDAYWYQEGEIGWGDPDSTVRFVDKWDGSPPPLDPPLEIVDRRGCDQDPIDAGDPEGGATLLSYVWPEPQWRFDLASAAIAQARDLPVSIDQEDAQHWVPRMLAERTPGTVTVLMHSVMWQYLGDERRASIKKSIEDAGAAATPDTPIAWLRLEPNPDTFFPGELRLHIWDGEDRGDELLANSGFHGGPLSWIRS
jgi:hypothetical protein